MPLTPADIHNMEFGKATLGKRGYDEEQVDVLLDEVSREMIRLLEENDVLQRRAGRPAEQQPAVSDGAAEAEFATLAAELDRARRACDQAEQQARQMRDRLAQARQSRQAAAAKPPVVLDERVLAMAQRTADDHLQDADQESHKLLTEAQERSAQLVRDARAAAEDVERVAQRRHSEAAAALQSRRTGLLHEIAELTQFAEDYRSALEGSMVRQQQMLEGVPIP